MAAATSNLKWRTRTVVTVAIVVWGALSGRLIQLQWISHSDFSRRASRQQITFERIPARPGDILDRNGRFVLATTVAAKSVYVVPRRIAGDEAISAVGSALADALSIERDGLIERITSRRDKHFLWVKRRISEEEVKRLRELDLPKGTWGFREEYQRRYPLGQLAAHVIGLRDIDGRGRSGLEQSLDVLIGGRPGRRRLVRDALGRVIDVQDEVAQVPVRGHSIAVTLDVLIQLRVERELDRIMERWKPKHAAVIVMVPQNGEVLAMASRPTFDPNALQDVPAEAWSNQAISAVFEPGSTLKPLVVAWGLQHEIIEWDEVFDCEYGAYRMNRRVLHDHHPYGELSLTDVLVKSSNIGMAKIGQRLTNRGLYEALMAFGLGRKTGIELPGEATGMIRPVAQWNDYSTGSIPMGQELGVSAIQMITAYAALSNGGCLVRPTLVRFEPNESDDDDTWQQHGLLRVISDPHAFGLGPAVKSETVHPEVANWIVQVPMRETVLRGTGRRANIPGHSVFGKTGTAQKMDRSTGKYSSKKHISSFICGAPAEAPQVLVYVVVDEPDVSGEQSGGVVAAPVAASILRQTLERLGIAPTLDIAGSTSPLRIAAE